MIVLQNLSSMTRKQLNIISRAVYVVKCSNKDFPNLYSCGAAGNQQGKGGTLGARLYSHARPTWPKPTVFRHRAAPFGERVWALHLEDWTELGVQLAEHALQFRLGLVFSFVHNSCFLAKSNKEVLKALEAVILDFEALKNFGNSTACENRGVG